MYKLYSIAGSCSTGITVLLEKLGLDYEVIQRSDVDDYQSLVPTNQVPALVSDNSVISEGAAIVLYLLEKHCDKFSTIDILDKAKFYQMLMFNYATLHPAYSKIMTISTLSANKDMTLLQNLADNISDLWVIIDNHLENNQFMFHDEPTIIDYLIAIYTNWGKYMPKLNITIGDNVLRLAKQIYQTREFISACEKEGIPLGS
jgi:glutathione S-transferase